MKHAYCCARPLLAALFLLLGQRAVAQQFWRPFRPGLIYGFSAPGSGSVHTLRLDSAYRTPAGDSAWTFGRLMKTTNGREQSTNPYGIYRKSRNNLFGARLIRQQSPAAYLLENQAEASFQAAATLELRPQAAVGSSWAASLAPALTATLTSRSLQQVQGVADSVAVITLSSGQVVRLSRSYGLLEGPQWLSLGSAGAQWSQAFLPTTVRQPAFSPLTLFAMQPGDELGYLITPAYITPYPPSQSYLLRHILTRRQTADSLVITNSEQARRLTFDPSFGTLISTQILPVSVRRIAFSLRTGQSAQYPALGLLTGEYLATGVTYLMGRGIIAANNTFLCQSNGHHLSYIMLFPGFGAPSGQFSTGIDIGWEQKFSLDLGLGEIISGDGQVLVYYRQSTGSQLSCGSSSYFAGLLATHATQAAALATLAPNPATEVVTLTLAQPARPGTGLGLTDALGREVWRTTVPAGQTVLTVPLAGQPAGLYLLRMSGENAPAATWKLVRE